MAKALKKLAPKKAAPKKVAKKSPTKAASSKKDETKKAPKKSAPKKDAKKSEAKSASKKSAKKANPAFAAPLKVSATLAKVVGNKPLPRTEIVKKIWDYIKKNNLQDQKNKRMINADENLKPIFGKDQVSMFEIAKVINVHVEK